MELRFKKRIVIYTDARKKKKYEIKKGGESKIHGEGGGGGSGL